MSQQPSTNDKRLQTLYNQRKSQLGQTQQQKDQLLDVLNQQLASTEIDKATNHRSLFLQPRLWGSTLSTAIICFMVFNYLPYFDQTEFNPQVAIAPPQLKESYSRPSQQEAPALRQEPAITSSHSGVQYKTNQAPLAPLASTPVNLASDDSINHNNRSPNAISDTDAEQLIIVANQQVIDVQIEPMPIPQPQTQEAVQQIAQQKVAPEAIEQAQIYAHKKAQEQAQKKTREKAQEYSADLSTLIAQKKRKQAQTATTQVMQIQGVISDYYNQGDNSTSSENNQGSQSYIIKTCDGQSQTHEVKQFNQVLADKTGYQRQDLTGYWIEVTFNQLQQVQSWRILDTGSKPSKNYCDH